MLLIEVLNRSRCSENCKHELRNRHKANNACINLFAQYHNEREQSALSSLVKKMVMLASLNYLFLISCTTDQTVGHVMMMYSAQPAECFVWWLP